MRLLVSVIVGLLLFLNGTGPAYGAACKQADLKYLQAADTNKNNLIDDTEATDAVAEWTKNPATTDAQILAVVRGWSSACNLGAPSVGGESDTQADKGAFDFDKDGIVEESDCASIAKEIEQKGPDALAKYDFDKNGEFNFGDVQRCLAAVGGTAEPQQADGPPGGKSDGDSGGSKKSQTTPVEGGIVPTENQYALEQLPVVAARQAGNNESVINLRHDGDLDLSIVAKGDLCPGAVSGTVMLKRGDKTVKFLEVRDSVWGTQTATPTMAVATGDVLTLSAKRVGLTCWATARITATLKYPFDPTKPAQYIGEPLVFPPFSGETFVDVWVDLNEAPDADFEVCGVNWGDGATGQLVKFGAEGTHFLTHRYPLNGIFNLEYGCSFHGARPPVQIQRPVDTSDPFAKKDDAEMDGGETPPDPSPPAPGGTARPQGIEGGSAVTEGLENQIQFNLMEINQKTDIFIGADGILKGQLKAATTPTFPAGILGFCRTTLSMRQVRDGRILETETIQSPDIGFILDPTPPTKKDIEWTVKYADIIEIEGSMEDKFGCAPKAGFLGTITSKPGLILSVNGTVKDTGLQTLTFPQAVALAAELRPSALARRLTGKVVVEVWNVYTRIIAERVELRPDVALDDPVYKGVFNILEKPDGSATYRFIAKVEDAAFSSVSSAEVNLYINSVTKGVAGARLGECVNDNGDNVKVSPDNFDVAFAPLGFSSEEELQIIFSGITNELHDYFWGMTPLNSLGSGKMQFFTSYTLAGKDVACQSSGQNAACPGYLAANVCSGSDLTIYISKNSGYTVHAKVNEGEVFVSKNTDQPTLYHEIGHALGLWHDFAKRDAAAAKSHENIASNPPFVEASYGVNALSTSNCSLSSRPCALWCADVEKTVDYSADVCQVNNNKCGPSLSCGFINGACLNVYSFCGAAIDSFMCIQKPDCFWVNDKNVASIFGAHCLPRKAQSATEAPNIGARCVGNNGCYLGCGDNINLFRTARNSTMAYQSQDTIFSDYEVQLMREKLKRYLQD